MDLSTTYLGLSLKNPIVVSSSRLTGNYNKIIECISNGAGAVVLKSLFEEQIIGSIQEKLNDNQMYFWYPEATEFVKKISKDHGVSEYIRLLKKVKASSEVPVIASINCTTSQGWPSFAKELQDAGADAIELNISIFPFDEHVESKDIEDIYVEIIREVKKHVTIPVAAKIGPCFTNINRIVSRLCSAKVDGIVLFNRFFRPDINIEDQKVIFDNYLSEPSEMTQSLRWIGALSGKISCDLIANTGIHNYQGVIKQMMAGATAVQICSTLFKNGIPYIRTMIDEMEEWMRKNNHVSLESLKNKIHIGKENTAAFERVQFMQKSTGVFGPS
jgi:dihydroorotate dehydrogenase (fumarate)